MAKRLVIVPESWAGDQITYAVRSVLPQSVSGLAAGEYSVYQAILLSTGTVTAPLVYSLTVDFDPLTDENIVFETNGAGLIWWVITANQTQTAQETIAHTGAYEGTAYGTIETAPGSISTPIPDLGGTDELFIHAVMTISSVDQSVISEVASTRAQIGDNPAQATITVLSGNPTITNYSDADGTWRAWEWAADGAFEVVNPGAVEYELIAGGGGGGSGRAYTGGGGGGAGGRLASAISLTAGQYPIVVGQAGLGRTASVMSTNGGNTTALDLTAIGGGAGGQYDDGAPASGGSGGGYGASSGVGAGGTNGQGFAGGNGIANRGGGGGGHTGAGAAGNASTGAGNGGPGFTSLITGTATGVCGGGIGSGGDPPAVATHGGGNSGASAAARAATGPGGGGAAAYSGGSISSAGNGFRGRFVIRIKQGV